MKVIRLEQLQIKDFKGVRHLDINFDSKSTTIEGPNASGKTTIIDAFNWLLFDKNSKNETKFEIKPLDKKNNVIRCDSIVSAVFNIDGKKHTLTKLYKEKWEKKHGETEETFAGNKTVYEIDEVPTKKSDYKKFIEDTFTSEELFKLLTNPLYFSEELKWKDAREIILSVSGDVSNSEVIASNKELEALKDIADDDNINDFLKKKKAISKKLIEEKKEIPIKIDTLLKNIEEIDIDEINKKIAIINDELNTLNIKKEEVQNNNRSDELIAIEKEIQAKNLEKHKFIADLDTAHEMLMTETKKDLDLKRMEETSLTSKFTQRMKDQKELEEEVNRKKGELKSIEYEINDYRKKYVEINNTEIDLSIDTVCPLCNRPFSEEYLERKQQEVIEKFNLEKAEKLKKILDEVNSLKARQEKISKDIEVKLIQIEEIKNEKILINKEKSTITSEIEALDLEYKKMKSMKTEEKTGYKEVQTIVAGLDEEIEKLMTKKDELNNNDNKEVLDLLDFEIKTANDNINKLQIEKGKYESNSKLQTNIKDLEEREKEISIKIGSLEKEIMLAELFITTRVDLLENKIANKFKGVSFKLFEQQVNGGINETCEALIDGVPFSNANSASKINAGLSIINTISDYYNLEIPIFVDNRESIIDLEDVNSQLINLAVKDIENLTILGGTFNE